MWAQTLLIFRDLGQVVDFTGALAVGLHVHDHLLVDADGSDLYGLLPALLEGHPEGEVDGGAELNVLALGPLPLALGDDLGAAVVGFAGVVLHADRGGDGDVLLFDDLDNIGGVVGDGADEGALHEVGDVLVEVHLVGGDGPDDVGLVLPGQFVDVADARVVLAFGVGVAAGGVEVAEAVVGGDDAAELAVHGDVAALIGGEDDDAASLFAPTDTVTAYQNLNELHFK